MQQSESSPNETSPNRNSPNGAPANRAPDGMSGGQSSGSISHVGATELTEDATLFNQGFSSASSAENALLVSGAIVTLSNPTIDKTGDDNGDNSDFYGTNAAVFAYNAATLNIDGGSITTDGSHANAVFAYSSGIINISDTRITTNSNNSGGIMVTGGGTITATNLSVETSGNSSAPIRSDRGGGTITVDGGTYTSNGVGSPTIYSTADITVKNAELTSTASEAVVIEGSNSVTLESTNITDTNNTLNGNSETYKNIFIYQSMSGDAETGTGTFTAKNSVFVTNKGDHFFITNTTAKINLTNNKFTNNDPTGAFLRAQSGKWGTAGSNGGNITLSATSQKIIGDIVIDDVSSLDMTMVESYYMGTISNNGTAKLNLDTDSIVVLTGDSYLSALNNTTSDNSNIYANGHKLYVNGNEIAINQNAAPSSFLSETSNTTVIDIDDSSKNETGPNINIPILTSCLIVGAILVVIAIFAIAKHRHKQKIAKTASQDSLKTAASNTRTATSNNETTVNNSETNQKPPVFQ